MAHQIGVNNDRKRFEEASKAKSAIVERLVNYLGDNVESTREQDECFNTEQGPWDNGRLWCQVATVVSLKGDVDYSSVAQQYVEFGHAFGWSDGSNKPFDGSWIEGSPVIKCQLVYQNSSGKTIGLATLIPFKPSEKVALAMTCADRAQASYYPYVTP